MSVVFKRSATIESTASSRHRRGTGALSLLSIPTGGPSDDASPSARGNSPRVRGLERKRATDEERGDTEQDTYDDEAGEGGDSPQKRSCRYKIQHRLPHLYYVTLHLLLPLMTLIGMAFLFGGLLAQIEMKGEIQHNDEVAANIFLKYVEHIAERQSIYNAMANTSVQCLADTVGNDALMEAFPDSIIQTTEEISDCASERGREMFPASRILPFIISSEAPLTFNWMSCWKENTIGDENATFAMIERFGFSPHMDRHQQLVRYLHRFYTDWRRLNNESGIPDERLFSNELAVDLINQSTGSGGCEVHIAGGALFWFTVMTTIGYGNTAPTSEEGRLLVCTAGFLTIILFIALNNTAAQVWRDMFEHWFLKFNLPYLVQGPLSILFWLCLTFLWMLVVAAVGVAYQNRNFGGFHMPLKDLYWFSYITITTVGFGDIHIQHEEFRVYDMFHIPLLVLIGFNFLGIFAEKAAELYCEYFPQKRGYADILGARRLGVTPSEYADIMDPSRLGMPSAIASARAASTQLIGVTTVAEC